MLLDNINPRDDLPRSGTRANIIEQNLTPALSESSPEEGRNVGEAVPRAGAARFVCSFFLIATAEYRFNGWEWEQPQGRTVNKNIVHPVGNLSAVHPPGRGGQCFRCRARSWVLIRVELSDWLKTPLQLNFHEAWKLKAECLWITLKRTVICRKQ
jgi:hypothetical protein